MCMLGTTLPGFGGCNPPWLRLSQSWDDKPLRRQGLSPWQGCHLCPLHPAWPWAWPVSQWWVRILKGGSTLRQSLVTREGLGVCGKRGWWTLAPWLWNSLSPHSVCKKSPNLLAALRPCLTWAWSDNRGRCSPVLGGADTLGNQA